MAKRISRYLSFDHNSIHKLLQNRLRLAILSAIAHSEEVDFVSLRDAVHTTDGNLSLQLKLLEEAGWISINKLFIRKRPQTNIALTNQGRSALLKFREVINQWTTFE